MTQTRSPRRTLEGKVIGTKMNKTIVVRVENLFRHPKYGKFVRQRKKYYAHDEQEKAGIGDQVEIMACRPLSKLKRWQLVAIVQAAPERGVELAGLAAAEEVLAPTKASVPTGGGE